MRRTHQFTGAAAVVLMAAWGCGGSDRAELETPATVFGDDSGTAPRTIAAEGCLTAQGNRYVLTEIDRARTTEATTESYRLVGMEAELRGLVGQRVEVTGAAEPERVVDVREVSPSASARTPQGTSGADAAGQVATVQSTRLEIGDLRVSSVNGTGARCVGGARGGADAGR